MVNARQSFLEQVEDYVNRNPHFKLISTTEEDYLKGILSVPNDEGEVIGDFLIEIRNHDKFPLAFPILFEVGGQIPNEPDWHKYSDHSCCITVQAEEILLCKNGITVEWFIKSQAIPFLANYLFRKAKGFYKNGEFAHGTEGNHQYYEKLFQTKDKKKWVEYYQFAFDIKKHGLHRNQKCMCGSGKKFKNCHTLVFRKLKLIGKENVYKHLTQ